MNANLKMGEDFVMFPHPVITLAENMSKEEKGEFYQAVVDFLFGNDVRLESLVVIFAFSFIKDVLVSVTDMQKKSRTNIR